MSRILMFFLVTAVFVLRLTAQGPGFSISIAGNYNFTSASPTLVGVPFSEVADNRFKTYDVLEEHRFTFKGLPGVRLSTGVQWRLNPSLLIGTGLSLGYSAFDFQADFQGYRPMPGGSDTLFLPILITQPPCDQIILPDGFDPSTDPDIRQEMLQVQIPLEIRFRPGKGQMEGALGVWAAMPAFTRVSREQVLTERRYRRLDTGQTVLECIYNKGVVRETTGDGFRNVVWGVRGEFNYRINPTVGLFAGIQANLSNLYDTESRPLLTGRSIQAMTPTQLMPELGIRYLWENATAEASPDKLQGRINKASPQQMFQKKGKKSYLKKKRRR